MKGEDIEKNPVSEIVRRSEKPGFCEDIRFDAKISEKTGFWDFAKVRSTVFWIFQQRRSIVAKSAIIQCYYPRHNSHVQPRVRRGLKTPVS